MTDMLDKPAWNALHTRQADLAEGTELALRYRADVAMFAAARDESPEAVAALGSLVGKDKPVAVLEARPCPVPPGTVAELVAPAVQMIADTVAAPDNAEGVLRLGDADAAEMLALATLTQPGPFFERTQTLGDFYGIRIDGRLAAMAGERIKLPGMTEVSGVCTHPDFRGKGYAAMLSRLVASKIIARGETPILHAWASNTPAIRLYETLGFRLRSEMVVTMLGRT